MSLKKTRIVGLMTKVTFRKSANQLLWVLNDNVGAGTNGLSSDGAPELAAILSHVARQSG